VTRQQWPGRQSIRKTAIKRLSEFFRERSEVLASEKAEKVGI